MALQQTISDRSYPVPSRFRNTNLILRRLNLFPRHDLISGGITPDHPLVLFLSGSSDQNSFGGSHLSPSIAVDNRSLYNDNQKPGNGSKCMALNRICCWSIIAVEHLVGNTSPWHNGKMQRIMERSASIRGVEAGGAAARLSVSS
jgi:hypothetical protein